MSISSVNFGGQTLVGINGLSCTTLVVSSGLFDASIAPLAAIAASKVNHQYATNHELFPYTTTVVALTKHVASVQGATCAIYAVQAWISLAATGADRTVVCDLQRSTGGGAFASVLSPSAITIVQGTAPLTPVKGTVALTTLVAGDILRATVTVNGVLGNQAQGLGLTLWLQESVS
jgi:hypothetical protein